MEHIVYEILYRTEKEHWWYVVRRKIVHDLIKKYGAKKTLRILDVGCGAGELMKELEVLGHDVSGIDVSEQAISFCEQRGLKQVQRARLPHIPYPDRQFDVVLCLDVLEHLEDDEAAITSLRRVLKPDGIVIIFVPTFMSLWGTSDDLGHHLRRYRLKELKKKFTANDIGVIRSSYFNTFLFLPIFLIRIIVRLLRLKIHSENELSEGLMNKLLLKIFLLESSLLKRIDFPFGVSGLLVGKRS